MNAVAVARVVITKFQSLVPMAGQRIEKVYTMTQKIRRFISPLKEQTTASSYTHAYALDQPCQATLPPHDQGYDIPYQPWHRDIHHRHHCKLRWDESCESPSHFLRFLEGRRSEQRSIMWRGDMVVRIWY